MNGDEIDETRKGAGIGRQEVVKVGNHLGENASVVGSSPTPFTKHKEDSE